MYACFGLFHIFLFIYKRKSFPFIYSFSSQRSAQEVRLWTHRPQILLKKSLKCSFLEFEIWNLALLFDIKTCINRSGLHLIISCSKSKIKFFIVFRNLSNSTALSHHLCHTNATLLQNSNNFKKVLQRSLKKNLIFHRCFTHISMLDAWKGNKCDLLSDHLEHLWSTDFYSQSRLKNRNLHNLKKSPQKVNRKKLGWLKKWHITVW